MMEKQKCELLGASGKLLVILCRKLPEPVTHPIHRILNPLIM